MSTLMAGKAVTRSPEEALQAWQSLPVRPVEGYPWLTRLREQAKVSFARQGFPTSRDEAWRFTQINGITRQVFTPSAADWQSDPARKAQVQRVLAEHRFGAAAGPEVVLVDGRFEPELSTLGALPGGAVICGLIDGLAHHSAVVQRRLGKLARVDTHAFAALNTAHFEDGLFIHVPAGVRIEKPVHVLLVSTTNGAPVVSHPRLLMVVEDGARISLVKTCAGADEGVYFTNMVSEVHVGEKCSVDHCRLQQEGQRAQHVSMLRVRLGAGSSFVSHSATIGGAMTRNDLEVLLEGEGAEATLNGLVIAGGSQHVDNHTLLEHAAPNCPSHELYKHVLDGRASAVFKGQILVRQIAQKTDSKQTSRTLLLSDDAVMQSMPALEIYADDVKCTHGSTTGPVDEDMLFYLRTRGLEADAARHLLTYAFAADITRRIAIEGVRARLEDYMARQHDLPTDLRITDLGRHDDQHR